MLDNISFGYKKIRKNIGRIFIPLAIICFILTLFGYPELGRWIFETIGGGALQIMENGLQKTLTISLKVLEVLFRFITWVF